MLEEVRAKITGLLLALSGTTGALFLDCPQLGGGTIFFLIGRDIKRKMLKKVEINIEGFWSGANGGSNGGGN
ncbi:MAG: hypothetical protein GX039_00055 [Clostridia bacterium]|nr:hypothetical protein [Clostridia bacterium]